MGDEVLWRGQAGYGARLWPYRAELPQRFGTNYTRYRARGGTARPAEDVQGFAAGGGHGDSARFLAFTLAFDQIAKEAVAGAVAELGVRGGHTAHALTIFARRLGRHSYLFDEFSDDGDRSLAAVRDFVGVAQTTYCPGSFPAATSLIPPGTVFCLVHLDGSVPGARLLSALSFFYPLLAPGGFLLVHDYASLASDAAERVADAFFADKPECLVPLPDAGGTAVMRRRRASASLIPPVWPDQYWSGWLEAADPLAAPLFVEGWSSREDWGRWGIGTSHVLRLYHPATRPPDDTGDILLEVDAETVLLGAQTTQQVCVLVGGKTLDVWRFAAGGNRGVRAVRIRAGLIGPIEVTFRPAAVASPAALTAGAADLDTDDRPLGMAVHRLRARVEPPPPPDLPIEPRPPEWKRLGRQCVVLVASLLLLRSTGLAPAVAVSGAAMQPLPPAVFVAVVKAPSVLPPAITTVVAPVPEPAEPEPAAFVLPAGALTVVTVHYFGGDPRAVQQAAGLAAGLREFGFIVGLPSPTANPESVGTRFVFAEDEDTATRVAAIGHRQFAGLPEMATRQKPSAGSAPHPGEVVITLSGRAAPAE